MQSRDFTLRERNYMAIRTAVASTDGKVVNCHFGKAGEFLIFDLHKDGYDYIGNRKLTPCCSQGEHEYSAFENAAEILYDCSIIIVSRIGIPAADFLESRGFEVYEAPFMIHSVLEELIKEKEVLPDGDKL